jgi:hypothetical protein
MRPVGGLRGLREGEVFECLGLVEVRVPKLGSMRAMRG